MESEAGLVVPGGDPVVRGEEIDSDTMVSLSGGRLADGKGGKK